MKNSNKPSVVKNYIYNLSYQVIAVILPFITTPYVSRHLGASAIGAYSYTSTIASYFSLFGIAGLNVYGQLQIAKSRDDKKCLFSMFAEIEICKIITALLSIICYLPIILESHKYKILFTILSILLISNIFDISWFYQGIEEFRKIVIRNYIIKIISIILIFTLIKKPDDIYVYAIIIQWSTLIGNISLWKNILPNCRKYAKINSNFMKHIIKSMPFFLPAIASSVYLMMDKIMLGIIIGSDYQNGLYEQAHKIEGIVITLITSLNAVLLPRMSYLLSKNNIKTYKNMLYNIMNIIGLIIMPMMCGLYAISEIFVPVFLGKGFNGCILLVKIFSFLLLFSGTNTIIGNQCLVARGKQKEYNIGVCTGAVVNVILNTIFIHLWKSYGAAIASVLAECSIFCIFVLFSKEILSLLEIVKIWLKYFCGAAIMAGIVLFIGRRCSANFITLFMQLAVGVIIYSVYLIVIKDNYIIKIFNTIKNKLGLHRQ